MDSAEIRNRFVKYFTNVLEPRGLKHTYVPSSPLVPERHPTLLFVNSGMVQFTPYFLGQKDPVKDFGSKRLCSYQKSLRTGDLDIVGKSKYHLTFFEMLGSWSIGDYGKETAVEIAFNLLANKEYGFGLDPGKLIPTVFCGNKDVECDLETINAWKKVGIPDERISRLPASENWWSVGGYDQPGPCGPCTEVLYDRGDEFGPAEELPGLTDNPRYLEIWNAGVFMQYNKTESGKLKKLPALVVDTGAGLERLSVLLQGKDNVYETDLFEPIIEDISCRCQNGKSLEAICRIADHVKASVFLVAEGVCPSNTEQGYVLRRLIRQAFKDLVWKLEISSEEIMSLVPTVIDIYKDVYPEVNQKEKIVEVLKEEHDKYKKIADVARRYKKRNPKATAFDLYQSAGASWDLIDAIFGEFNLPTPDREEFEKELASHQEKSRHGAGKKFKGGLIG